MFFQYLSDRTFLRVCSVGVLVSFFTLTLFAQNPPKKNPQKKMTIAVLNFEGHGVNPEEAASLSDVFQGVMVESQQFTVVDRNRIKSILEEQGFQQSEACSQVECIVQVGKILKVEKMFAGSIGKVGNRYTINIQVIDVQTAQILSSKPRQHEGAIEDLASDVIPDIAREMIEELTGKRVTTVVTTTGGGSGWLWYVGGALVLGGGAAAALLLTKNNQPPVNPTNQTNPLPGAPVFPN
jgi:TolB-like protein